MQKHDPQNVLITGTDPEQARRVVILIHGRGADAESILQLSNAFDIGETAWIAPQATHNTWYPYSFMKPIKDNEPWFSSAIEMLDKITGQLKEKGVDDSRLFFMGFSQGACLALDYAARRASKYGGLVGFSGGLIGDTINPKNYRSGFDGTPVFIGCDDKDFHIPESRVHESADQLEKLGANVDAVIYPGMGHTIIEDEIRKADQILKGIE